jgi:hypothetical protein
LSCIIFKLHINILSLSFFSISFVFLSLSCLPCRAVMVLFARPWWVHYLLFFYLLVSSVVVDVVWSSPSCVIVCWETYGEKNKQTNKTKRKPPPLYPHTILIRRHQLDGKRSLLSLRCPVLYDDRDMPLLCSSSQVDMSSLLCVWRWWWTGSTSPFYWFNQEDTTIIF